MGDRIVEVNYDIYAEGEAVLGWLNASFALSGRKDTDWGAFAEKLTGALKRHFDDASLPNCTLEADFRECRRIRHV